LKKTISWFSFILLLLVTDIPHIGTVIEIRALDLELQSSQQRAGLRSTYPNDTFFEQQYALHNTGQTGGIPDCDIDGPEAWNIETGNSDVIIAFVDSGIDYTHPDLSGKIWINTDEIPDNGIDDDGNNHIDDIQGWNFYDDNNDVLDLNGHGTICAGIAAAASNNSEGITGVCWNCRIMPLKVNGLDNGEDIPGLWIEAIEYAVDKGADIISMSLGTEYYHEQLENAVNQAYNNGVFLVASAGNQGWSNEHYPAAYSNVIGVSATNDEDRGMENAGQWGATSNFGSWVDVAAPGEDIFSTMPTYHVTLNDYGFNLNYTGELCGTSCSAPHVAGVAGLLLSFNSSLSPNELKTIICGTTDPYDSEYDLGSGRVNVNKALLACITPTPTNTPVPPTKTPTGCETTGVSITMPSDYYRSGDTCSCEAIVCNAEGSVLSGYPLFVVLEAYGSYYFAPSFAEFDFLRRSFQTGETPVSILPEFTWPSDVGSGNGITWFGALTNPEMTALYGELGTFSFGWGTTH
jgi:subtilisin family serine protease